MAERDEAERRGDDNGFDAADKRIKNIKKQYSVNSDGEIVKRRRFHDPQYKKTYDLVVKTIKQALDDVMRQSTELGLELLGMELRDQLRLANLEFVPKDGATPWRVERMTHKGMRR